MDGFVVGSTMMLLPPRARAVAAILVVGATASCGSTTVPESRPASIDAQAGRSGGAEPTDRPSAGSRVPANDLRIVAVDGLVTADAPAGSDPFGAVPTELIRGEAVWVLDVVEEPGQAMAFVVAGRPLLERELPMGWIPLELNGEPTLVRAEFACPDPPLAIDELQALGRFGGLACYGGDAITVEAFAPVACGIGGSPRTGEPDWLNGTWSGVAIGDDEPTPDDPEVDGIMRARVPPGVGIRSCGLPGRYRFRAHFDDPASADCRTTEAMARGEIVLDARLTGLLCRSELVLEAAVPVGGRP